MQTALVAGGAGFIGSHLCESLLSKGYQVICVDNYITGSKTNVDHLLSNTSFSLIEHDLSQLQGANKPKIPHVNFVFHLASPASPNQKSPRSYIAYPVETLLANAVGTYNLLQLAAEDGARFLFASTSEVYGDPLISPQPETYWGNVNPVGIRSVYDEGKRYGEAITQAYFRKYHLDTRIIRIFNTYGPKMQKDDGRVVSNFITQALEGKPLTIFGDGNQTRSFCYITDLIDGIEKMMFTENLAGEIINLGNPNEKTITEFATLVQSLTGSSTTIVHEAYPEDDPKMRKPDITKAKTLLAWEPKVSLENGLKKTIAYFKNA